ncbi:DUF6634 family protein [Methylobacterium soli]|uniref:DUF6634 family protein n=1 Tax=Methylobacterium soli TaxID=553447 RepID=UPI00177FF54E|nr:DUF6634 family protein [Methylobacterium soli]GJE45422.1 hypothetical protein AEGHOMDF_4617 [Methylobacterium soli]
MLVAFTGPGCPSSITNVALLATRAALAVGLTVNHVRVIGDGEPPLGSSLSLPNGAKVVEAPVAEAADAVSRAVAGSSDLTLVEAGPGNLGRLGPLPFEAVLLGIGPYGSDERRAALAIKDLPEHLARVTWLLGLGRSGADPRLCRFEREMVAALAGIDAPSPPRVLFAGLPPLRRVEVDALLDGGPSPRALRVGIELLAALAVAVQRAGGRRCADAWGRAACDATAEAVAADGSDEVETLRCLADDLERIAEGDGPTPEDLAGAPVLERWQADARVVRSLVGIVGRHPILPPGRHVRTSEVYATDGRTWARTLSRFYALGSPMPQAATGKLH